jgi:hypothetical protein
MFEAPYELSPLIRNLVKLRRYDERNILKESKMNSKSLDLMLQFPNNSEIWSWCWDMYVSECGLAPFCTESLPTNIGSLVGKQDLDCEISTNSSGASDATKMPKSAFVKVKIDEFKRPVFLCTVPKCGKSFSRRAENATAHYLLHKQIAPFQCRYCASGFRRAGDLRRHITIHSSSSSSQDYRISHKMLAVAV